jgi:hypothetical protein
MPLYKRPYLIFKDELLVIKKYINKYLNKEFIYFSISITDLEILVVLVTRLLRQDLNRLVNGMEPVELWDEG